MSSAIVSQSSQGSAVGYSLGNNRLKRKQSNPKKYVRKAQRTMAVAPGLRRYLNLRGTPDGTYEINRHMFIQFDALATGIPIGAGNYEAATFMFTPGTINLVSGIAGNTSTWNIPNYAELTALWDKVKIDRVVMKFMTSVQGPTGASASAVQSPIYFAEDDNDTTASLAQVQQMECTTWQPGMNTTTFTVQLKPKYQRLVYYTALASSYEPTRGYVVSNTEIPHYGLKIAVPLNAVATQMRINCDVNVYYKLKELK